MRQQALETKHFIEKQEEEERKLLKIISEADTERLRQKKELDQVGKNKTSYVGLLSAHFLTPLYQEVNRHLKRL